MQAPAYRPDAFVIGWPKPVTQVINDLPGQRFGQRVRLQERSKGSETQVDPPGDPGPIDSRHQQLEEHGGKRGWGCECFDIRLQLCRYLTICVTCFAEVFAFDVDDLDFVALCAESTSIVFAPEARATNISADEIR